MELNENIGENEELNELNEKVLNQEKIIEKLNSEIEEKDIIMSRTKAYLFDLEYNIDNTDDEIANLKKDKKLSEAQTSTLKQKLDNSNAELNNLKKNIEKKQYKSISKLQSKDYCITCLKEEINDKNYEIEYLKKNNLIKKILSPLSYIYLIFKSKPKELRINFKLNKALKNSKCFDVGYYLNNNKNAKDSFLCKYFSPEFHYIVKGFDENYEFSKKYFNTKSKQELIKYIYECNKY